jgi:hypothetical protein
VPVDFHRNRHRCGDRGRKDRRIGDESAESPLANLANLLWTINTWMQRNAIEMNRDGSGRLTCSAAGETIDDLGHEAPKLSLSPGFERLLNAITSWIFICLHNPGSHGSIAKASWRGTIHSLCLARAQHRVSNPIPTSNPIRHTQRLIQKPRTCGFSLWQNLPPAK